MGVKGITLGSPDDEVIGMVCVNDTESSILVVSANGYGKRSAVDDYRITNRGGKGVKTLQITEKTGELISILNVTNDHDLMIVNKSGITIRMSVEDLRVMGRATQGVRLISLRGKDEIASVCRVPKADDEEVVEGEEGEEGTPGQGEDTPEQGATPETDESTTPDTEE
jgi:DNA gyrase subunit A